MPYIIDGHNLIPHIPGLSLKDLDDENSLIAILQKFASRRRSTLEVFFDHAPAARTGTQTHGLVRAHFITRDSTADQAIKNHLSRLGKSAKNWTVVSSDREILAEARSSQCQILKSSDFALIVLSDQSSAGPASDKNDQPDISPGEVDYWLDQFGSD
jgi:hypothetical protein